ncbi:MAG: hypothetical protein QW390_03590 [Candidatus Bathyarchaeia archaeon]
MKTLTKDGFKLPYIGKDKFAELMRSGVGYDPKLKLFFLREKANREVVKKLLAEILKEEVEFEAAAQSLDQTCFLCGAQITCKKCEYYPVCPTRELAFEEAGLYCMCPPCSGKEGSYLQYVQKWDAEPAHRRNGA